MIKQLTTSILICVMFLSGLPVFGQTETVRGVKVRMKNEQTNRVEEVELYKKSYALIIGESRYKFTSAWKELEGVRKDVVAVEKLLREQGFDEVVVVQDLNRVQLDGAIRNFIGKYGLARENRLLIYYAGHGYTETTEDGVKLGYIVPIDAPSPVKQPEEFSQTAISMNDIESYALSIRAKHVLFVFDSCFSGSVLRKTRASIPPIITLKAAQAVRQFITSGSEDQEVPDVSEFRKQFEEGLRGEADRNGDGYITGSELGDFLQEKVTNYSKGSQTPLTGKIANGNLDKGDFIFLPPSKSVTPPKPPRIETAITEQTPAEVEREAWLDIQAATNPNIFREFIKEYPTGANVGKAKIRLEQLVWDSTKDSRDKAKLQSYLNEFPNGVNASRARLKLSELNTVITPPVQPAGKAKTFKSSIGMEFVLIPSGSFEMGSNDGEGDEKPVHRVTISKEFYMGKYEVTQGEWKALMGSLPTKCDWGSLSGEFVGDRKPIICVSWTDAQDFVRKLNAKGEGKYRLPSEAEWEYAARSGTTTKYSFGDSESSLGDYAWYEGNAGGKTQEVGTKKANEFGLYDMHGNVYEWCNDWYGAYTSGAVTDPSGPANGSIRVVRGGSWGSNAGNLRSAFRYGYTPSYRSNNLGFRLIRE